MAADNTRSFFAGSVPDFLNLSADHLVGKMADRLAELHRAAEFDQMRSWRTEIALLKNVFIELGQAPSSWSILFEVPILRLGRRMDVVILAPGVVIVIEFKVGATRFSSQDIAQTEYYALSLRDFHAASQSRVIVPILCAENSPRSAIDPLPVLEGVANTLRTNAADLGAALAAAVGVTGGLPNMLSVGDFERSPYRPTPNIIEAARALYAGHTVADISRGEAASDDLERSGERLVELVLEARVHRQKVICFVTGTPGAGKTLLGLNLALKSRVAGGQLPPASLLSGNPPLVHVIVEALAQDAHRNRRIGKPEARREASSAVQGLLGFLREHTDGANAPERVIVFDEAQRAWDAEVGQKLLNRPRSEPALFLDIMARSEWACLICLVGPGQEINRGEGGLALWGAALREAAEVGTRWHVRAAPQAINGGPDVGPNGLFAAFEEHSVSVRDEPLLHLANAKRSYRNPQQVRWVAALLDGDIEAAAALAANMVDAPALVSRDLPETKAWLRKHRRGDRSVGLVMSSGAVRLIAEGLPPAPRSNELDAIAHWFLKPFKDYRSSGALETPLSEFGCQGLELDYVGLCWGGDLIWENGWQARTMAAPHWRRVKSDGRRQFRINGYRVLLTRARIGTVIYVPTGDFDDDTRSPAEFDHIADVLMSAGCEAL